MEVISYNEGVYLLSKRQIVSFKVEKLQENFTYGLNEDILKEKLDLNRDKSPRVSAPPTVLTAEVRQGHILQRDLLQEAGTLAAGVTCHDLPAPQPIAEPGQAAVTVEGVGQEVAGRR